jgi:hypothetical protein
MTRRDYAQIAAVLSTHRNGSHKHGDLSNRAAVVDQIAADLCPLFKSENPLFDNAKFLAAVRGD